MWIVGVYVHVSRDVSAVLTLRERCIFWTSAAICTKEVVESIGNGLWR